MIGKDISNATLIVLATQKLQVTTVLLFESGTEKIAPILAWKVVQCQQGKNVGIER